MKKNTSSFKGKIIVVGVCGGIAAYKAAELVRRLIEAGAEVHVVMTSAAREFVTPLTFQTLSGHSVHTDLFNLTEEGLSMGVAHISLADRADVIVIAPATADLMARAAHGLCNDLLTTILCATRSPVVLVPSMNVNMWNNAITQDNLAKLRRHGWTVVDPDSGELACGYNGKGRLPDPDVILKTIEKTLTKKK